MEKWACCSWGNSSRGWIITAKDAVDSATGWGWAVPPLGVSGCALVAALHTPGSRHQTKFRAVVTNAVLITSSKENPPVKACSVGRFDSNALQLSETELGGFHLKLDFNPKWNERLYFLLGILTLPQKGWVLFLGEVGEKRVQFTLSQNLQNFWSWKLFQDPRAIE